MPDGLISPGQELENGSAMWSNPYNIFTTTACGPFGISVKVEHSSSEAALPHCRFGPKGAKKVWFCLHASSIAVLPNRMLSLVPQMRWNIHIE